MKKFKKFYFNGFKFNKENLTVDFFYSFDNKVNFKQHLDLKDTNNPNRQIRQNIDTDTVKNLCFHISLMLGISYYKLYPTSKLIVTHGHLNRQQKKFWTQTYKKGLGEFFYKNKLNPHSFEFISKSNKKYKIQKFKTKNRSLIPVGGGKDSAVSISLIKNTNIDFDVFTYGPKHGLHKLFNEKINQNRINIQGQLDRQLFEMNKKGYYNGHVPITAIIGFISYLIAYFYDYKYIILSNEKSSNIGNLKRKNLSINHQYSKSFEFEKSFAKYSNNYMSRQIKYFSLLRGMYEIKIAKIFSQNSIYFKNFSSCNNNFHINKENLDIDNTRRCLNCPKCLFVYSMLRPFLTKKETKTIFNKELYENPKLQESFSKLIGIKNTKPFECVGTKQETILAMWMYYQNIKGQQKIPYIIQNLFLKNFGNKPKKYFTRLKKNYLKVYKKDLIPKKIKKQIDILK